MNEIVAEKDFIEEILCNDWVEFSENIDVSLCQDSFSWRTTTISRQLAMALLDDKGKIEPKIMKKALFILERKRFSLRQGRYHDASFMNHLFFLLKSFDEKKDLQYALQRIPKPFSHPLADHIIRVTLHLQEYVTIQEKHAKQAALAALFCSLRQNVGSCFATAPAIRIQQNYADQFLSDIAALFGTGRLKRVHEGIEYVVPLSFSFGLGELLKPILLHALGKEAENILASSYTFLIPLEKAKVIKSSLDSKLKFEKLSLLFKKSGCLEKIRSHFFVTTADEIISALLRTHFHLTEADLQEKEREVGFGLMNRLPIVRGNKAAKIERYQKAYSLAKQAFVAMTDNPLLKSWEFTLASLSESKADFAKWNLSVALGLNPDEPFGVGQVLYENIQQKISDLNHEIEAMQSTYDQLFVQAKQIEGRMTRSGTEKEQKWLLADYNVRKLEIDHVLQKREEAYEKGNHLRELFGFLLHFYQEKLQEYFQEVYDPEMHDLTPSPYDDSPAGFRLLYKHGRNNPSLWTYIYSLEEYKEALKSFFTATEAELSHKEETAEVRKELSACVTSIVLLISQKNFLEGSFHRLAKAYGDAVIADPLLHQERIKRKPWAYVSGGTMTTLLRCYYGLSHAPREETRWVESVVELFAFYLDTLKSLPLSTQNYLSDKKASLLAFSPTHAFLLSPHYPRFKEGWKSDLYSYTWIRDEVTNPSTKFLLSIELDSSMMAYLSEKICKLIPMGYRHIVKKKISQVPSFMRPHEYRYELLQILSYEKWLHGMQNEVGEHIDAILYESLPFTFGYQIAERIGELCKEIPEIENDMCTRIKEHALEAQNSIGRYQLLSSQELMEMTKYLLANEMRETRLHFDAHYLLQRAMHKLGFALKEPVLFADTNWVKNRFGFCVNPGTLELELWRFDIAGSSGRPMRAWREYVDGSSKGKWGILVNPMEYGEVYKHNLF